MLDKGRRKRDNDLDTIRTVAEENVQYLRDVHKWFVAWEGKAKSTTTSTRTFF